LENNKTAVASATDTGSIRYRDEILPYTLHFSSRRTLAIVVHHDGEVVIRAPQHIARSEAVSFLLDKAGWVRRKRREFQERRLEPADYRYVTGERHAHLGAWFDLVVESGNSAGVQCDGGRLLVTVRAAQDPEARARAVARQLLAWRRQEAGRVFTARLALMWERFACGDHRLPELKIRRMRRRWGSLIGRRLMILNLSLIKAPIECIDYVAMHELCHLYHRLHDRGFYALLDRQYPEWRSCREKLYGVAIR